MSVTLTAHESGDVAIVEASGRLTLGETASTLSQAMLKLTERGVRRIVLNMAHVSYIDSSGIGALIASHRIINSSGGQMKLSNLGSRVQRLLALTELQNAFETYSDEESALHSFRSGSPAAAGTCLSIDRAPSADPTAVGEGQNKAGVH